MTIYHSDSMRKLIRKDRNPYVLQEEPHPMDKAIDDGLVKITAIIIVLVVLCMAAFPLMMVGLKTLLEK